MTGLGFVCFVLINPRVLSTDRVYLGFFVSLLFQCYPSLTYSLLLWIATARSSFFISYYFVIHEGDSSQPSVHVLPLRLPAASETEDITDIPTSESETGAKDAAALNERTGSLFTFPQNLPPLLSKAETVQQKALINGREYLV